MTTAVRTPDTLIFDAAPTALPTGPLAVLRAAPEEIHPALALAWQIRSREQALGGTLPIDDLIALGPGLAEAIEAADATLADAGKILHVLKAAPPCVARHVPQGF